MIKTIVSFFTSQNPDKYWLQTLVILAIIMGCILLYKRQNLSPYYEGFSQNSKFVLKQNADVYDDFYVEIYNQLMQPCKRVDFEIDSIIQMTDPNVDTSVFLDIGSGTGDLVDRLHRRGYVVFGIDRSQSMVNFAEKKYPEAQIKCGNVNEPMLYDRGTFTHILCVGMTIYQFSDKMEFFRNAYYWLMSGGYLIVNLVDRDQFDTIVPGGKPPLLSSPQKYSQTRITDTIIDFVDFEYKGSYAFDKNQTNEVVFKETFTDELTKNVRQNEMILQMENMNDILKMATYCGFVVKGQVKMGSCTGDDHQYLCILERPN